jgi:hypothetical protein
MSFLKKVKICASELIKTEAELVLVKPEDMEKNKNLDRLDSNTTTVVDVEVSGYFSSGSKGSFQDGLQMEPDDPPGFEDIEAVYQADFEFMGKKYKKGQEVSIDLLPFDMAHGADWKKEGHNLREKWDEHLLSLLEMTADDLDDPHDEDNYRGRIIHK